MSFMGYRTHIFYHVSILGANPEDSQVGTYPKTFPLAVEESDFTSGSAAYSLCKLEQGFSSCASFSS